MGEVDIVHRVCFLLFGLDGGIFRADKFDWSGCKI